MVGFDDWGLLLETEPSLNGKLLALISLGAYQTKSFPFNEGSVSNNSPQSSKPTNNSPQQTTQKAFKNFHTHTHNQNKNNKPSSITDKQEFDTIGTFWERINNILGSNDGTDTSLASLFANSNSNNSYHGIKNWLRFVTKANANNDTQVISIKPYDAVATSPSVVHYKVRYDFKLHSHSKSAYKHIQIYNWTATFNNSQQIQQMGSPKKPAKDYIE